MSEMNRRKFLTVASQAVGVAVFSNSLFKGLMSSAQATEPAKGAPELKMLDPKDPLASALKYVEDYKKAPAAKGKHCVSCQLYNKKESKGDKEVGACSIFPGKLVYGNAYCNSYSKKA